MNKQEVFKVLVLIESVYPKFKLKSETVQIWFAFCGDCDLTLVMKKLCNHIRSNPYPPIIADIISYHNIQGELLVWERGQKQRTSWSDEYIIAR